MADVSGAACMPGMTYAARSTSKLAIAVSNNLSAAWSAFTCTYACPLVADLATGSPYVQQQLAAYLRTLADLNVTGKRCPSLDSCRARVCSHDRQRLASTWAQPSQPCLRILTCRTSVPRRRHPGGRRQAHPGCRPCGHCPPGWPPAAAQPGDQRTPLGALRSGPAGEAPVASPWASCSSVLQELGTCPPACLSARLVPPSTPFLAPAAPTLPARCLQQHTV